MRLLLNQLNRMAVQLFTGGDLDQAVRGAARRKGLELLLRKFTLLGHYHHDHYWVNRNSLILYKYQKKKTINTGIFKNYCFKFFLFSKKCFVVIAAANGKEAVNNIFFLFTLLYF
jgi:hypothetical protein